MNDTWEWLQENGFELTSYMAVGNRVTNGVIIISRLASAHTCAIYMRCPLCLSLTSEYVREDIKETNKAINKLLKDHKCDYYVITKTLVNEIHALIQGG